MELMIIIVQEQDYPKLSSTFYPQSCDGNEV